MWEHLCLFWDTGAFRCQDRSVCCRTGVGNRVLGSVTIRPCLRISVCLGERGCTSLSRAKAFLDGWPPKEGFKLGRRCGREGNQQPCGGVTHKTAEQRAWGDMMGRDHKMGLSRATSSTCRLVTKEMSSRQHYGEIPKRPVGTRHTGLPLLSACTLTHAAWGINKMS